ncbi:MAG: hypothetical protein J0I09_09130 [Sphingobacteriia bacterium]|nr:hypothetical protein [Sphingobacteriia bacterium]
MNTEQIVANSSNITLTSTNSNQFCTVWPSVKQGLQLLVDLVKNPIAKGAITLVIAAGDAVSKQICGGVTPQ